MEKEADAEIERHPGQVEQSRRTCPGQESPHLIEIVQRLQPALSAGAFRGRLDKCLIDPLVQALVERGADADEDPAAHQIEDALESIEDADQDREAESVGMLRLGRTRS